MGQRTKRQSDLLPELIDEESEEGVVKVLPTKEGVSIRRLHFKHALLNLQNGNIECATTKIINSNTVETPT